MFRGMQKRIQTHQWMIAAFMIATVLILAACSGGGSGGGSSSDDVRALSLPDRIELSNVEDESAESAGSRALGLSRGAYNDAGTDYSETVKHSWVDDTDALDMVNDILGIVKDTAYDNFINAGAYKALVRKVGDEGQSQSGSSATSTTTEQLMEIYVDVTRTSNDDPMIVKVWVKEEDGPGGQTMIIRGYFTVSQGVSADYPYGVMTAHFKGNVLNNDGSEGAQMFTMAMSVDAEGGNVVIENVEDSTEGDDFEYHRQVRVVANADVTEGNAYVSDQETDWDSGLLPDPTVLQIAFNNTHFKATEEGQEAVIYAKGDLDHRVFRYELFAAGTGAKVTRNSGFPIQTEDGKNGYVGYYGLWAPYGTTVAHGDTVYDMDDNTYTVFRAAGKLTKHTQSSLLLGDLTNVELSKWTGASDSIVTWNGSNFTIIGTRSQDGQITYSDGGTTTFQQWEGAWCESLKAYLRLGNICFNSDGSARTPLDSDTVYYHAEQTLSPSEAADLTLYTWSYTLGTPGSAIVQNDIDTADESSYWPSPTEKTFTFDAETMMLYSGSEPVVLSSGLDLTGTNYQWGYHIGPLTENQYTAQNHWQAHEATVYYTWNTGTDEWNQYVTVIDSNDEFMSFDAPISFSYTHATANDVNGDSTHNGKKFRLEYDGFSVNIPWAYNNESGDWQPLINIKDGTVMGPNGDDYVIKGIEESLIMTALDDTTGITFDNEEDVGEPTLAYDSTKTDLVGNLPSTAVLKVIKGELID